MSKALPTKRKPLCNNFNSPGGCQKKNCKFEHKKGPGRQQNHKAIPPQVCRDFWSKGQCSRSSCKYEHRQNDLTARSSHLPLTNVTSSDTIVEVLNSADSSAKGPSAFITWKKLQETLDNKKSFSSTNEAEKFAFDLHLAGTEDNDSQWGLEDVQKVLLAVSKVPGNGIELVRQILNYDYNVSEMKGSNFGVELSFQCGFLPLAMYLTSDSVTKSLHNKCPNILYTLVHQSMNSLIPNIKKCLTVLTENKRLHFAPSAKKLRFKPESFIQIFIPVIRFFLEYVSRFKQARLEFPEIADGLLPCLSACIEQWANDILSPAPKFSDSLLSKTVDDRKHAVTTVHNIFAHLEISFSSRPVPVVVQQHPKRPKVKGELGVVDISDLTLMLEFYEPPGGRHNNDFAEFRDISVIPTHEELTCSLPAHMPFNVPGAPHHLPEGSVDRHLDILFRLMREDFVGPLRSSILQLISDFQKGSKNTNNIFKKDGGRYRIHSIEATDLNIYLNAKFLEVDMQKDVLAHISIVSPFGSAKTLESGALIGLLQCPGLSNQEWKVHLGTVVKNATSGGVIDIWAQFFQSDAYGFAIMSLVKPRFVGGLVVFEVGGVMLESIKPFLDALKKIDTIRMPLARYIVKSTVKDYLPDPVALPMKARKPGFRWNLDCLLQGEKLSFDPSDMISRGAARDCLNERTGLDPSQVDALLDCLSRELAIVEGPPGTGKSYLGCELTRVLLQNGYKGILTLCFTNHALDQFLEHLLDANVTEKIIRIGSRSKSEKLASFNLRDAVEALAQVRRRRATWSEFKSLKGEQEKQERRLKCICDNIANAVKKERIWSDNLNDLLYDKYEDSQQSLLNPPKLLIDCVGDWEVAGMEQMPLMTHQCNWWLMGKDLEILSRAKRNSQASQNKSKVESIARKSFFDNLTIDDDFFDTKNSSDNDDEHLDGTSFEEPEIISALLDWTVPDGKRPVEELLKSHDLWSMSLFERRTLFHFWQTEAAVMQYEELERLREKQSRIKEEIQAMRDQESLEVLRRAEVVGCTTTGAARISSLLKSVAPRVLIVEEAGEVLETQILANLVPSIEFLILIGDHKQLRPHISSHHLSLDSKEGQLFRLDESLFERLVRRGIPMSILNVQRRMRPVISELIRKPLYPELVDHVNVAQYPHVKGISKDLVFLDHRHREDQEDKVSSSKTNAWEVQYIGDLVLYLIRQGYNRPGDIAVLTGYLGQLFKLKKHLAKLQLTVVLDDRDKANLAVALGAEQAAELEDTPETVVKRTTAASEVICRTIDNFQGEEAKIVIISLVRNSGVAADNVDENVHISGSIGFLKSPNRTNVALSRAKHGMYILGNASLLKKRSPIWNQVLGTLEKQSFVLPGIPLRCENHPNDEPYLVEEIGVIPVLAPDGGCQRPCNARLTKCGHTCTLRCHPDDPKHIAFRCVEPCPRLLSCSHACPKRCYEVCGDCNVPVAAFPLPCGHTKMNGTCHQKQHPDSVKCLELIQKSLPCGHSRLIPCKQKADNVDCTELCGKVLDCTHARCKAKCKDCTARQDGSHIPHKCEKRLQCNHLCQSTSCCNQNDSADCPPCLAICTKKCAHFDCSRGKNQHQCGEPCKSCLNQCVWQCEHRGRCLLPCGQPCSRLPCDEPCGATLTCGCPCPSICGEPCSHQICPEHASEVQKDQVVDFIMMTSLRDIIEDVKSKKERLLTLGCGHVFTKDTLDGIFEINKYYKTLDDGHFIGLEHPSFSEMSPIGCPQCRETVNNGFVYRYGRVIKRIELEIQERHLMQRLIGSIEATRSEIATISLEQECDGFNGSLATFHGTVLHNKLPTDFLSRHKRKLSSVLDHVGKFIPHPKHFKNLQDHGFSDALSKIWQSKLCRILELYQNIFDQVNKKTPHTEAYESAFTQIYRAEVKSLADAKFRVRDPHRSAMEAAATKIGCPKPLADVTASIKLIWLSLELRYYIFTLTESLSMHIDRVAKLSGRSVSQALSAKKNQKEQFAHLSTFRSFILSTCVRDANRAIELCDQSSSRKLQLQGHVYAYMASFKLSSITAECQLKQQDQNVRPSEIAKQMQRDLDTCFQQRYDATQEIIFAQFQDKVQEALQEIEKIQKAWQKRIDLTKMGTFYSETSKDELVSILKAMQSDVGGTTGHFFRCPNGHSFMIGECGGAMELSTCPQCGAVVGGQNHQLADGNIRDRQMEDLAAQVGYTVAEQHWDDR